MVYLVWPALERGLDESEDMVDTLVHCWILDEKQPEGSGSGINSRPLLCYLLESLPGRDSK